MFYRVLKNKVQLEAFGKTKLSLMDLKVSNVAFDLLTYWNEFFHILLSFKNSWKKKVTALNLFVLMCVTLQQKPQSHTHEYKLYYKCVHMAISQSQDQSSHTYFFFVILWTSVMCSAVMGLSFWQCRSITFAWFTEMCVVLKLHGDNDTRKQRKIPKRLKKKLKWGKNEAVWIKNGNKMKK